MNIKMVIDFCEAQIEQEKMRLKTERGHLASLSMGACDAYSETLDFIRNNQSDRFDRN